MWGLSHTRGEETAEEIVVEVGVELVEQVAERDREYRKALWEAICIVLKTRG